MVEPAGAMARRIAGVLGAGFHDIAVPERAKSICRSHGEWAPSAAVFAAMTALLTKIGVDELAPSFATGCAPSSSRWS